MIEITNELIKLLICPISKGKLFYEKESNELISLDGSCAYPVRDGVPLLLPENARKMRDEELLKFRKEVTNV